jgi:hypothetical protein
VSTLSPDVGWLNRAIPAPNMPNLYSFTEGQAAICDWFHARHNRACNLPLFPSTFPDQFADMVRVERGLSTIRLRGYMDALARRVWIANCTHTGRA